MDPSLKATIAFSMSKNRIRIHRNTLSALGNPSHVVLIVNPEEKTLGIKCSTPDNVLAHRIDPHPANGKLNCELYSKSLFIALKSLCPFMTTNNAWSFDGTVFPTEKMAVFALVPSNNKTTEYEDLS